MEVCKEREIKIASETGYEQAIGRPTHIITVGKKRYDAAAIEALADQLMTDTYICPGQG